MVMLMIRIMMIMIVIMMVIMMITIMMIKTIIMIKIIIKSRLSSRSYDDQKYYLQVIGEVLDDSGPILKRKLADITEVF